MFVPMCCCWCKSSNEVQIGFQPRVLIPTNDDAIGVLVQEKDFGARWCFLKEIVLNRKVQEGVVEC